MKTLIISLEKQYPFEHKKYAVVGHTKGYCTVLREGGNWLKEDAIDSIPAIAEGWIAKGYKISQTSIKKYNLQEMGGLL